MSLSLSGSCRLLQMTRSATHLGTCTKLELPLMLVLLAPFKLTCLEGLATDNNLEPGMLISSASNSLQLSLSHWRLAAEPTSGGEQRQEEEAEHLVHVLNARVKSILVQR